MTYDPPLNNNSSQVAAAVGGGKTPEQCFNRWHAEYNRQQQQQRQQEQRQQQQQQQLHHQQQQQQRQHQGIEGYVFHGGGEAVFTFCTCLGPARARLYDVDLGTDTNVAKSGAVHHVR